MAPSKKKSKAKANTARGFSTISVPSKSQANEASRDASNSEEPVDSSGKVRSSNELPIRGSPPKTVNGLIKDEDGMSGAFDIKDMSPEQLEAHLEDAELHALLEANGARCKSAVARQVSKLNAERRQLRLQSRPLSTKFGLDDEIVDEILQKHATVDENVTRSSRSRNTSLLLDLWVLQQVLEMLNMPELGATLSHVLNMALSGQVRTASDTIYGLSEALDWLAMYADPALLPDYEVINAVPRTFNNSKAVHSDMSNPTRLKEDTNPELSQSDHLADNSRSHTLDSDGDSGDDSDPSELVGNYVQVRAALWHLSHFEANLCRLEPKAGTKTSRQLQERLSRIERDILLDRAHAEEAWRLELIRLSSEHAACLRVRKMTADHKETRRIEQHNTDFTSLLGDRSMQYENTSIAREGQIDDIDEDELFGDMFTTAEDPAKVQIFDSAAQEVRLADFGKWTGVPPRSLLEEFGHNLDDALKIKIHQISQNSFSVRDRIELFWSQSFLPGNETTAALPQEFFSTFESNHWVLEMRSIAVPSLNQADSFVSTVALFLVASLTPLGSKIGIRLPGVWREFFKGLEEKRKEIVQANDKSQLKDLKRMIQDAELTVDHPNGDQDGGLTKDSKPFTKARDTQRDLPAFDSVTAQQHWESRSSRTSFRMMLQSRFQLPIYDYKDYILEAIRSNQITIICAETGSGKSTQIGSFILENQLRRGRDCRIVVTQPRRISAISLARRVSEELGESRADLGTLRSLVGYAIRLESKTSASTRLTFATTGVLLRMIESSPTLEQLDYLILDEVHERTMDLDLLFIALREVCQKRPDLKVVLMSATVNARVFSDYFGGAPVLDIPGRIFPVNIRYLEDALEATNDLRSFTRALPAESLDEQDETPDEDSDRPRSSFTELENYSKSTRTQLAKFDEYRIDYELIAMVAVAIATKQEFAKFSSAILIFMPGIAEIRRLQNVLLATDTFSKGWIVHLLHSSFSTDELEKAFAPPPPGCRKIVIATNIAETGITIPDVTAVIDTCKEKIMRFDERRQLSKLTEGFISRSSARQRRGRAARVQEGLCFHLVTKYRHDKLLLEQPIPEMLRLSLQDPILRTKIWNLGSIEDTLADAIDPPSRKNILRAIEKLKDAGALTASEDLTPLGQKLARLPLEVTLAKLAMFGVTFKCLDVSLTMVSLLTSKSPFLTSAQTRSQPDSKRDFNRANSDLLTTVNAYEGWRRAKSGGSGHEFSRRHYLHEQSLLQIEDQKVQLLVYLVDAGLVVLNSDEKSVLNMARISSTKRKEFYRVPSRFDRKISDEILSCIIAMALYPRILVREGKGWRNVYTNQHITLTARSVNHGTTKPPTWLSFYEAMQSKGGQLNVFETTAIPEIGVGLLLGVADIRLLSGVISIDNGRIRLGVRHWRQAMAIKVMRMALQQVLDRGYRDPGAPLSERDQQWIEILFRMLTGRDMEQTMSGSEATR